MERKDKVWAQGAKDTSKEDAANTKSTEAAARKAAADEQAVKEEATFKGKPTNKKFGVGNEEKAPSKSEKQKRADLAAKALAAWDEWDSNPRGASLPTRAAAQPSPSRIASAHDLRSHMFD